MYDYREDLKKLVEDVKLKERERILGILSKNNIDIFHVLGSILND